MQRSLQKYKHVVDGDFIGVDSSAATQTQTIALGSDNPVIAGTTNVQARARIKAIYMELTFHNNLAAPTRQEYNWIIYFNPQTLVPVPDPRNQGSATNKNYVIKSGVVHVDDSVRTGSVRGLIRIPSKYQRFMNGDLLQYAFRGTVAAGVSDYCRTKFIYKEIRG